MVTGRVGQSCAAAVPTLANVAARATARSGVLMFSPARSTRTARNVLNATVARADEIREAKSPAQSPWPDGPEVL
jgi:hypothetical protein